MDNRNLTNEFVSSPVRKYSLIFLAVIYLVIRFGFTQQLDGLGEYASYVFEVVCLAITILLVGGAFLSTLRPAKAASYGMIIALIAGFAALKGAVALDMFVPFDLQAKETILLLLIVAPLLEESIFLFMLWQPVQILTKKPVIALLVSALLFSYSHFHAIWFTPPEVHQFIIYQSLYTLVLALGCGYYVYRYSSLASAICIHFAFNLGFYIASIT